VLAGPGIAAILYLMPTYAIHEVPALAPCRGQLSNVFVTVMGPVAMPRILYGIFG
jgi:serine transporter